jgi:hypothetical protein
MKMDNITSGCSLTMYCPNNPVIRGDMAIFIMRGGFNAMLPASEPVISSISPNTLANNSTATFTITGQGTHFVQGITRVNPVAGITAGQAAVTSDTSMTVSITCAATLLPPQPVSIWVTTYQEEAVLPAGLMCQ